MGCISSKVITKSLSFRQEMSHSLQRTIDGIPVLEEIFTTGPEPALLHPSSTHESINITWELIAGLEEQQERKKVQHADHSLLSSPAVEKFDIYKTKWSKSCHWLPENEMYPRVPRDDRLTEDEFTWGSKGIVRSRSFHTVEEYDAMVENIQLVREQVDGFGDHEHDSATEMQLQHSQCSSKKSHCADYYCSSICETTKSSLKEEESSIRENSRADKTVNPLTSGPGTKQVLPSLNSSSLIEKSKILEDVVAHEGNSSEKGLKRKAIAQSLKSLQIPSTVEFPSVTNLRERLHVGRKVYSPGAYVTPKFGSYNLPIPIPTPSPRSKKEFSENSSIFDPDLVAAFEECMIQLVVEEEIVLKQIEQVLEEDCTNDAKAEEESSSNTHLDPHSG